MAPSVKAKPWDTHGCQPCPAGPRDQAEFGELVTCRGVGGTNKTQVTCGKCTKEPLGTRSPSGAAEKKGRFWEIGRGAPRLPGASLIPEAHWLGPYGCRRPTLVVSFQELR